MTKCGLRKAIVSTSVLTLLAAAAGCDSQPDRSGQGGVGPAPVPGQQTPTTVSGQVFELVPGGRIPAAGFPVDVTVVTIGGCSPPCTFTRTWNRATTTAGPDGRYRFTSIKPGRVPGASGALQAPHISVMLFARGLLRHLNTRMYFPDDAANADDPVLRLVPDDRRRTLIAARRADGTLEWNVVLQGRDETVFFEY